MEKPQRIAQLYAYSVCLVAVITFLMSTFGLVMALTEMSDPWHASRYAWGGYPDLSSFEAYKLQMLRLGQATQKEPTAGYVPDEETLRAMYEAAKAERIQAVRLQARRRAMPNGLLIVVCIVLFALHWRWARKLTRAEA
ncbi:MAG: hypothetical protein ACE5HL_08955 [Terriglobia bacterium]